DVDLFAVLGVARRLVVDAADLERRYHDASRAVHPDRHQTADDRMQALSLAASSAVNRAFRVLRDPVERGRYWLAAHGEALGIDLGTTNSLVALLEEGGPRCLPNPETGELLLPSAVAFLPNGEVVVGGRARTLAGELPFDVVLSVKRFMGLGLEHVTADDRRRRHFAEPRAGAGVVRIVAGGRELTPPEVS